MPPTLSITLSSAQLTAMRDKLKSAPKKVLAAVAGAINDTAKHEKTFISSLIREEVNIKKKDVDQYIKVQRATPTAKGLAAQVTLNKTARIPLKYFGATQTKKGVTYRIGKSGGRTRIPDAFGINIPRLGGNVFRRVGKKRLPIVKLLGPSAWGVFTKHGMDKKLPPDADKYLSDRLKYRLDKIQ